MTSRPPSPPRCACLACQLARVLELLRTGRTEAAHIELERVVMMVWSEHPERCARTGSVPIPLLRPPPGPEAA
jgi:hypothetical protein